MRQSMLARSMNQFFEACCCAMICQMTQMIVSLASSHTQNSFQKIEPCRVSAATDLIHSIS